VNTELTSFDLKFLADCGIPIDDTQASDKETDSETGDEQDEAAVYYRRIVEELG
jgi:hypothetical protein